MIKHKKYLGLNDSYNLAQTILKNHLQFKQNDLYGSEKGI
jgi:hypothetical protein